MLAGTINIVTDFHKFILKIILTADFENAASSDFSSETFNKTLQRVDMIKFGLQELQNNFNEISTQIDTWYKDDSNFKISDYIDPSQILNYVPTWPLIVNLLSACFCLGASTLYHLGWIHSERIS